MIRYNIEYFFCNLTLNIYTQKYYFTGIVDSVVHILKRRTQIWISQDGEDNCFWTLAQMEKIIKLQKNGKSEQLLECRYVDLCKLGMLQRYYKDMAPSEKHVSLKIKVMILQHKFKYFYVGLKKSNA